MNPEELAQAVEIFIMENEGLDERATTALREAEPGPQQAAITRGSLQECHNPSAALLGRLRDAQKGGGGKGATMRGGAFGGGMSAGGLGTQVERFLQEYPVDETAADTLRNAPPAVQQQVLARGGLEGTRNPSSALLGRLRDADKQNGGSGDFGGAMGGGKGAPAAWGGMGCGASGMSAAGGQAAWGGAAAGHGGAWNAGCEGGAAYGGKGGAPAWDNAPWHGADEQGAAAWGGAGGAQVAPEELQSFIEQNQIDERGATALSTAPVEVQRAVIDRGSLMETRNPSSALLGRLRDAQKF